LCQSLSAGK